MRAFIALELPPAFRADLEELSTALRMEVQGRFVSGGSLHVTLAFLGEVGEAEAACAIAAIEAACEGVRPVELVSTGLGTFGRKNDATLWLGVRGDAGLSALAEAVRAELKARGVAFDEKSFRPHITLARHAKFSVGALEGLPFPRAEKATKVTLFKSTLEPTGAVYKVLYSFALG